ncbi:MAG TPA: hypothetical protein VLJ39_16005 [Tepidisphaeraceae bacterium]|jgi:hypothetical protein|nr:hypothetical protein [Tepidisphaeraceae bacterium]
MFRTAEATIDESGKVELSEPVKVTRLTWALLTILDAPVIDEVTLLSESALSDWSRPEEDEAWKHLADLPPLDG